MPNLQNDSGMSGQSDDWKSGFDESSTKGLSCLECGSLVAPQPGLTKRHRDWHAKLDYAGP